MKFIKMHGAGNDYIFLNCLKQYPENASALAKFLSNRHYSVGGDGLVLILPSDKADFKMRIFNADGSEAEMCGNAIRCLGKYVFEKGLMLDKTVSIETLSGIKTLYLLARKRKVTAVTVNMGAPIFVPDKIPVKCEGSEAVNKPIEFEGDTLYYTAVSVGNPHAVIVVKDLKNLPIKRVGSYIENFKDFPQKTNVEFVRIVNNKTIEVRVWERGVGETLACGTGASAAVCACALNGLVKRHCKVNMLGGDLFVEWKCSVFLTGGADNVFSGSIKLPHSVKFLKSI